MKFYDRKYTIHTVELPAQPIRKLDDAIISKKISKKYLENIIFFIRRIKDVVPSEYLYILYNNINGVSIKSSISKKGFSYYECIDNRIKIKNNSTIWHELLHLSTGVYDKKKHIEYNGFRQTRYKPVFSDIGFGLNEGYTQLLAEQYFKDQDINNDYYIEKIVAQDLELLIGQEKMEKLYFSANLYGLVEELKKYTTENDVYEFIVCVDNISKLKFGHVNYTEKDFNIAIEKAIEQIKKINSFFIKVAFAKKQHTRNCNFNIISDLVMINGKKYEVTTKEAVNNYYSLLANEFSNNEVKKISK